MHVAIIMDGNGRWAERRGLARSAGHRAGARAVRRVVEGAARSAVDVLTLYAFSSDNWSRPADEVASLMRLLKRHLIGETARLVENGIRVNVIGRRDRLSADLVRTIEQTERATARGRRLVLRLAVDYSAREAIVRAAQRSALGPHADDGGRDAFAEHLEQAMHALPGGASVDLLIRTGGERRLSDFLLWECAYAELVFVDSYWPDYDEQAFAAALREFNRRDRRFGGLHARSPARRLGQAR